MHRMGVEAESFGDSQGDCKAWKVSMPRSSMPQRLEGTHRWMPRWCRLSLLAFVCNFLLGAGVGYAQDAEDPLSWDRKISRHFQKYCYKCHRDEKISGDVNLSQDVDIKMILDHRDVWEKVLEAVEGESMPPDEEKSQPTEEERSFMVQFLKKTLVDLDCEKSKDPGKPPLRRLNRTEYDNSIKNLVGLDLHLAEEFPPDPSSYGFDHIGESLTFDPQQIEQYHSVAQKVMAEVLQKKEEQPDVYRRLFGGVPGDLKAQKKSKDEVREVVARFASKPIDDPSIKLIWINYLGSMIRRLQRKIPNRP